MKKDIDCEALIEVSKAIADVAVAHAAVKAVVNGSDGVELPEFGSKKEERDEETPVNTLGLFQSSTGYSTN